MKRLFWLSVALVAAGAYAEMRPDGHFGKRLDKMLANHVEATDPVKLAALYRGDEGTLADGVLGQVHARGRIPSFAAGASVKINGKPVDAKLPPGGYCELRRKWRNGEIVELTLPMPVRTIPRCSCP